MYDTVTTFVNYHPNYDQENDMPTYKIVRFFQDPNKEAEVIQTGLTLEEAQEHCNDPETSASSCSNDEGVERTQQFGLWFDGYTEEAR